MLVRSAWRSCGQHVIGGSNVKFAFGAPRLCSTRLYAVAADIDERSTNEESQAYGASKIQVHNSFPKFQKTTC